MGLHKLLWLFSRLKWGERRSESKIAKHVVKFFMNGPFINVNQVFEVDQGLLSRAVLEQIYTHEELKLDDFPFTKQNADFQDGFPQAQSTATPPPTSKFLITNESFQVRYYVRIFLKGHQNGQRTKFQIFNFSY